MKIRKTLSLIMAVVMAVSATAWGSETGSQDETVTEAAEDWQTATQSDVQTALSKIDSTAWQYNAEDDVYYQIGISYRRSSALRR